MNKITIIIAAIFCSCGPTREEVQVREDVNPSYEYDGTRGYWLSTEYKIKQEVIDSCEYIIIFGVDGRNIIHKANCKNHKNER